MHGRCVALLVGCAVAGCSGDALAVEGFNVVGSGVLRPGPARRAGLCNAGRRHEGAGFAVGFLYPYGVARKLVFRAW